MFAVSPSYSHASSGSDDDHAVFCFCGNEVEKDEDGEVGIYCSVREYLSFPSTRSSLHASGGLDIALRIGGSEGRRKEGKEKEGGARKGTRETRGTERVLSSSTRYLREGFWARVGSGTG